MEIQCPGCGLLNPAGAPACSMCGAPLAKKGDKPSKTPAAPKPSDSSEMDFSGLLDRVKSGVMSRSDVATSQDDLLKSLEGLSFDLADDKGMDESAADLDQLLADFEGAYNIGGKGGKPGAKPPGAPAARPEGAPAAAQSDLPPPKPKAATPASTAPAAGLDDLPPLKPKAAAAPAEPSPAKAKAAGAARPAPSPIDELDDLLTGAPGKPKVMAKSPGDSGDIGLDDLLQPAPAAGKPAADHAGAVVDDIDDLLASVPAARPAATKGGGPSPAAGADLDLDLDDLLGDARPPAKGPPAQAGPQTPPKAPPAPPRTAPAAEAADLPPPRPRPAPAASLDDLPPMKAKAPPAPTPPAAEDDLEALLADMGGGMIQPAPAPPAAKTPAPATSRPTPSPPTAPAPAKAAAAPADVDDLLADLGLTKPAAPAPARPAAAAKTGLDEEGSLDDFLKELEEDQVRLEKPPAAQPSRPSPAPGAPAAVAPTATTPAPAGESLDDFLEEITGDASAKPAAKPPPGAPPPPSGPSPDEMFAQEPPSPPPPPKPPRAAPGPPPSLDEAFETFLGPGPSAGPADLDLAVGAGRPEDGDLARAFIPKGMAPPSPEPPPEAGLPEPGVLAVGPTRGEVLLKQVQATRNEDRRYELLQELARLHDPRTVPGLVEVLEDPPSSTDVKECIVEALGRMGDRAPVEPIIKTMEGATGNLLFLCVEALGQLGDPMAEVPLLLLYRRGDESLKYPIVKALGQLESERAVGEIASLAGHADRDLRFVAAEALGRIRSKAGCEALSRLARDGEPEVRVAAIHALGLVAEPSTAPDLIALLEEPTEGITGDLDPEAVRRVGMGIVGEAVRALGAMKARAAVRPLLSLLEGLGDRDSDVAGDVIDALGRIGDRGAVPVVLNRLRQTGSLSVQQRAVEALGVMGDPTVAQTLVDLLSLGKEALKLPLALALGRLRAADSLRALVELASDADVAVRRTVAEGLGALEDPAGLPTLSELARDPDEGVRREVARSLGKLAVEDVIGLAVELLHDPDDLVAQEAAGSLQSIGRGCVDSLVAILGGAPDRVRAKAVQVLGTLGDLRSTNPLLSLLSTASQELSTHIAEALVQLDSDVARSEDVHPLQRQGHAWLRYTVARELGRRKIPQALPILLSVIEEALTPAQEGFFERLPGPFLQLAREVSRAVGRSGAELLGEIAIEGTVPAVRARLDHAPARARQWLIEGLGYIGTEEAFGALVALVVATDSEADVDAAGHAIRRISETGRVSGRAVVERLVGHLADDRVTIRRKALRVLGLLGSPLAIRRLEEMARDPDEVVRMEVLGALGRIGTRDAYQAVTRLVDDASEKVQLRTVELLSRLPDERALVALEGVVDDRSRTTPVRQAAVRAVGQITSPAAVRVLCKALSDRAEEVRQEAVERLGVHRTREALDSLMDMVKRDVSARVRQAAVRALGRFSDPATLVPLLEALGDREAWVKTEARKTLVAIAEGMPEDLVRSLSDPRDPVACGAIEVLGQVRNARITQLLVGALENRSKRMRSNSATVLGLQGDRGAVDPLVELLEDRDFEVRERAATALGGIGDIGAVKALRRAQRDQNKDVRVAAADALKQILSLHQML